MVGSLKVSTSATATILTENEDVPGPKFESETANYTIEQLKRWLKCRGLKQAGKREDLLARMNDCLKSGNHHILDPGIDNGNDWKRKFCEIGNLKVLKLLLRPCLMFY